MITVEYFEAVRPQLLSVAHRILGSAHDAQDAVQSTWLRAASAGAKEMSRFIDRIHATCPLVIKGSRAYLVAPGGHPLAGLHIDVGHGRISRITLRAVQPGYRFAAA